MKRKFLILLTAIFVMFLNSCAGRAVKGSQIGERENVTSVMTDEIRRMIGIVDRINSHTPASFTSSIEIIGNVREKKFKSIGSVQYDKKAGRFNITFLDYIFKSPVTRIFQNGERISIYFPADKKLVLDNSKTIDIRNYMDLNLDYYLISELFRGSIPVLKGYKVKKGLASVDGKRSYLIIENSDYFETISFRGNNPDKLLIICKDTKEKIELYLKGFVIKGKSRYYKKIRIVAEKSGLRLDFRFRRIRINVPVKVRTIESIRIPRSVKVIRL
jgi:hypothetical protein